jgi:hypothetical protein
MLYLPLGYPIYFVCESAITMETPPRIQIYCLSVNDAFVMRQWGLHQVLFSSPFPSYSFRDKSNPSLVLSSSPLLWLLTMPSLSPAPNPHPTELKPNCTQGLDEEKSDASNPLNPGNFQKVKLIPDGACLFTRGMDMSSVWDTERGFGERSWRYSAVINDMKIEKIFVEGGGVVQVTCPTIYDELHCPCLHPRLLVHLPACVHAAFFTCPSSLTYPSASFLPLPIVPSSFQSHSRSLTLTLYLPSTTNNPTTPSTTTTTT